MEHSNEDIQEIKNILEKKHGKEFSWEEASKAARDIRNFAGRMLNLLRKNVEGEGRLNNTPKDFILILSVIPVLFVEILRQRKIPGMINTASFLFYSDLEPGGRSRF